MVSNWCKCTSVCLNKNLIRLTEKLCTTLREATTIHLMRLDCIWRQGCLPYLTSRNNFHMPLWKKWCHPQVDMFQESIRFLIASSTIIQTTRNFVAFFLPVFANTTLWRWTGCPICSMEHMFWKFSWHYLQVATKSHLSLFQESSVECNLVGWKILQQREAQPCSSDSFAKNYLTCFYHTPVRFVIVGRIQNQGFISQQGSTQLLLWSNTK